MMVFFLPNSRALFVQIAQMGLILPRWVLILPRIPPPTPVLYSVVTKPFRDMYEHETPPAPPQNTPFPGLILKVGKMNYCLGKMDPIWAKCLKSGQNVSRSGQIFFIHNHILRPQPVVFVCDSHTDSNKNFFLPTKLLNLKKSPCTLASLNHLIMFCSWFVKRLPCSGQRQEQCCSR